MNIYKKSDKLFIKCILLITVLIICSSIALAYICVCEG